MFMIETFPRNSGGIDLGIRYLGMRPQALQQLQEHTDKTVVLKYIRSIDANKQIRVLFYAGNPGARFIHLNIKLAREGKRSLCYGT